MSGGCGQETAEFAGKTIRPGRAGGRRAAQVGVTAHLRRRGERLRRRDRAPARRAGSRSFGDAAPGACGFAEERDGTARPPEPGGPDATTATRAKARWGCYPIRRPDRGRDDTGGGKGAPRPIGYIIKPRAASREPRAASREPRAASRDYTLESRSLRTLLHGGFRDIRSSGVRQSSGFGNRLEKISALAIEPGGDHAGGVSASTLPAR